VELVYWVVDNLEMVGRSAPGLAASGGHGSRVLGSDLCGMLPSQAGDHRVSSAAACAAGPACRALRREHAFPRQFGSCRITGAPRRAARD
jgi:hypothetical protein